VDERLATIKPVNHPATADVTHAAADLVASGAPLTIHQAMRLKVQLRYMRTPVWRSVVAPSLTSLGDLHRVIQVLFGWDGDHLHEFRVDGRTYSDPSSGLEEAGEEEDVRIRDVFRRKVKVGYEYDFGAGWEHEITLQKILPLDAASPFAVCVDFEGESPEEYSDDDDDDWDDDDDDDDESLPEREREPFSLTAINAELAGSDE
jgi:hypothetical protein